MKRKDPVAMAQEFNSVRVAHLDEEMTRKTLLSLVGKILPQYNRTIPVCVDLGIIIRVKHGLYKFPGTPVHHKKLETFQQKVKQKVTKDNRVETAIRLLEKSNFVVTFDPVIRNGVRLSEAIKVAKKYGYTIIKD